MRRRFAFINTVESIFFKVAFSVPLRRSARDALVAPPADLADPAAAVRAAILAWMSEPKHQPKPNRKRERKRIERRDQNVHVSVNLEVQM